MRTVLESMTIGTADMSYRASPYSRHARSVSQHPECISDDVTRPLLCDCRVDSLIAVPTQLDTMQKGAKMEGMRLGEG